MQNVVIVAATRTPIGAFQGALSSLSAVELGATVIRSLLEKTAISADEVDEVILGQVLTTGCGQNPARQAALTAGLSETTPAITINLVCGSGLAAVKQAAQAIRCGDANIVIAGGQENMSKAPYYLDGARSGMRLGHHTIKDSLVHDGLWDAFNDYHMGITAENLAEQFNISREQQDLFALNSQKKAAMAIETGRFASEITPVNIRQKNKTTITVDTDEQPRPHIQAEKLAQLPPAFRANHGSVTAGNSSSINDGAAAVMLMSEQKAQALGLPILARIVSYAVSGVDPAIMGIGPVDASRRCLAKAGWRIDDLDLIEANEAFAAQALAVSNTLGWHSEKVNVNGGAIALGHPIGASGCRILVTLLHEMARRDVYKGLATLCVGGGQGIALAVERPKGASYAE
ncbi:acetyl-CoA C-acetyltransferase [Providencia vermicola]|uniref:acetyl-CoA C-acetyltransferase n=1 Tax=Providencia TaxID=586 RepID=UPI0022B62434|nr:MULTISPECIES: acetyl-CoA C-acetyltransferase [Providencia]ELR5120489.1 acetyl-CoA C-acetyltransferase [Providencia stuartii]ELR5143035.1 acetyl-CoA C-acetyltransferase [Providencia stuartii]WBA55890.1 acetyl-CoA C-acetyltransferase [Providencia sp. 21OH12SH02B-Prov]WER21083.1 acetyl-CoA C-acetyltransferase [Providencia stuartii]WER25203.1 acetyl-CoA C-acetyltransferase [Providencia stuartii]